MLPTLTTMAHNDDLTDPADSPIYTCPMHPQVHRPDPGPCPICGMALEPETVDATADTAELVEMVWRFWISTCFTLPLVMLMMGGNIPRLNVANHLGKSLGWIEALLAAPVVLGTGWPLLSRAAFSFRSRHLNMFSLIGVGISTSFLFSLVALLWPNRLPVAFLTDGHAPLYFESAAVITTLVLLGQVLELRARSKTGAAIRSLLALAPESALLVDKNGDEREIRLDQVEIGDHLRVRPGGRIPADGEILSGSSNIDESMLTGEAFPCAKVPGDKVSTGTLNGQGSFVMLAQQIGSQTVLSRIVTLVNEASRSQGSSQRLADQVAAWFVPGVFIAASLTFIVWASFGVGPSFANAFVAAVSVLIVACPCALGLATPISITVGMGRGAQQGVLIKNADALEAMRSVDTVVVDKTGTLTEGRPVVQRLEVGSRIDRSTLIDILYSVEQKSEHPLAASVVRFAKDQQAKSVKVTEFLGRPGLGVTALVDGVQVALGNAALMRLCKIDVGVATTSSAEAMATGESVIFVGYEDVYAGLVGISDPIRATTKMAVSELQRHGIQVILVTGDNAATAASVANQVGITDVRSGILPEGKYRCVTELQSQHRVVAMAGDGINDAPALAKADVGIAIGTGADIAMQSASIVLVKGDLMGIVKARVLSQRTTANIRQNLAFAFAYNLLGIPIAAGIFYPFFGILMSPMVASAAMALSSVCVITNALRLHYVSLDGMAS